MKGRHGYSLMELVLCVAIVATLAVLAFSVAGHLRNASNAARCASNLRTIGSAVAAYEADHDGFFPPSRTQYRNVRGVKTTMPFLPDLLNSYLRLEDVTTIWWCPGDTKRPESKRRHSYGHNQYLGGQYAPRTLWNHEPNPEYDPVFAARRNIREVPISRLIYLIDYVDLGDAGKWSSSVSASAWPLAKGSRREEPPPPRRIDFERHPPGANALFVDGSVRPLTFEDLAGTWRLHTWPVE
ncbi:MAG TPA: type II secretion system protein [Chthoniobacteraceae bacterium]|nr:type II secretion system protein [Chthoniobacteraceae bacterium]